MPPESDLIYSHSIALSCAMKWQTSSHLCSTQFPKKVGSLQEIWLMQEFLVPKLCMPHSQSPTQPYSNLPPFTSILLVVCQRNHTLSSKGITITLLSQWWQDRQKTGQCYSFLCIILQTHHAQLFILHHPSCQWFVWRKLTCISKPLCWSFFIRKQHSTRGKTYILLLCCSFHVVSCLAHSLSSTIPEYNIQKEEKEWHAQIIVKDSKGCQLKDCPTKCIEVLVHPPN